MTSIISYIFILANLVSSEKYLTKDRIQVLPGIGIIINSDSVRLKHTDLSSLKKRFNIKSEPFLQKEIWDGVVSEGKRRYGVKFSKEVIFKGIKFTYESADTTNFKLMWIRIPFAKNLDVTIDDKIFLGQLNPPVDKYFKSESKYDYVAKDSLTYNLYSQGISFRFQSTKQGRKLEEVSIHYKLLDE